jgi:hypothetical protein
MKHWEHHPEPVEGCFGCKAITLQMNTGDAHSQRSMPTKAFNKELDAYKAARAQGIQPAGTSMKKIQEAVKASDILGKPYDSSKMAPAKHITKESAAVLNQLGA